MKAQNLMIGNLVNYQSISLGINDPEYVIQNGADIQVHENFNVFNPIPITPEWLERAGFEKERVHLSDGDTWVYSIKSKNDYFEIENHWDGGYLYDGRNQVQIKYIHQLQNLYFALTQKQLEFKKP